METAIKPVQNGRGWKRRWPAGDGATVADVGGTTTRGPGARGRTQSAMGVG